MDIDVMLVVEQSLRVLACAIIGLLIGYEREIKSKPAGLLTFSLVCVGSCLLAILQENIVRTSTNSADEGRIIAQVVSGIGFLGAGTIIQTRSTVKGITTAALLWVVAALGLMIGTGGIYNYIVATLTVGFILPISYISRKLGERLTKTRKVRRIRIVFDENYEKDIFDNLSLQAVTVRKTYLVNKYVKDDVHLKESIIYVSLPKTRSFEQVLNQVSLQEYVYKIEEA